MSKMAMFLRDELEKVFKNGIPKEEFDTMESLIGIALEEYNEKSIDQTLKLMSSMTNKI